MQSSAVVYYFLNVWRDSANQYKYSEGSWLMLENSRRMDPRCFKILCWEIERSLLEAGEGQSKPPASHSPESTAAESLKPHRCFSSETFKTVNEENTDSCTGRKENLFCTTCMQKLMVGFLICREDMFVCLFAYYRRGWQRGVTEKKGLPTPLNKEEIPHAHCVLWNIQSLWKQACLSQILSGEHLGLKHPGYLIQLLAEKYKILYQNTKIVPSKQSIWNVLRRHKHTQHTVKHGRAKIVSVWRTVNRQDCGRKVLFLSVAGNGERALS